MAKFHTADKAAAELERLNGMNGKQMKPELAAWLDVRKMLLTKVVALRKGSVSSEASATKEEL